MSPYREVTNPGAPLLDDDDDTKRGMSAVCPRCSKRYPFFDSEDRPQEIPTACARAGCNSPMVGADQKAYRDFADREAEEHQQPWPHKEKKAVAAE